MKFFIFDDFTAKTFIFHFFWPKNDVFGRKIGKNENFQKSLLNFFKATTRSEMCPKKANIGPFFVIFGQNRPFFAHISENTVPEIPVILVKHIFFNSLQTIIKIYTPY